MAVKKWTDSQQNAIDARRGAVLVSAAAGSGKTAVLVQRVMERLTDAVNPTDADKLLVVTYTRAAAAEMRERIYSRLNQLIHDDPFNAHLQRQLLLLNNANISTIHSFCNEVVKENFYSLEVSSSFRLADDTELSLLKNDALNNALEQLYNEQDSQFSRFTEAFSTSKSDKNLTFTILKLYEFLCSHPFPDKWLLEKEQMYDFDCGISDTQWGMVIMSFCRNALDFCRSMCDQSLTCFSSCTELGEKLGDLLEYDNEYLKQLDSIYDTGDWNAIKDKLKNFDFGRRFPVLRGYSEHSGKIFIQNNRNEMKSTLTSLLKYFNKDEEKCRNEIYALSPIVHQLFKTVQLFGQEYSKLKKEKNILDFSDLEHLTLQVLVTNTEDGYEYTQQAHDISARFDEVMVDEYQDANEVQETIFNGVSDGGKKLFVVGDVKQSIYSFRQAMPEIFLRRKASYPLYIPAQDNYPAKIILDKNFRSRNGVTSGVNFVFKRLMSKDVGDMQYTDEEKLVCGASYPMSDTPDVAFHLLNLGTEDESNMDILESRHIGKIIKDLVGNYMVTDGDGGRPAQYSDCAILLRNANAHAGAFVNELNNMGIPANSDTCNSFLLSQEIAVMVSMLKIIDNPIQDIPLLTVLMSPIYGFTADDMADIRILSTGEGLYLAVKNSADKGNEKAKGFLADMEFYRQVAACNPTDSLINVIYSKTGYMEISASTDNGVTAVNNLRLLQEHAKTYEQCGYKGLCGFVRFINRLEEQGGDLSSSSSAKEPNAVRVMSIHRSKGLEFPICFIATMSRSFNNDKRDEALLHRDLGLGLRYKVPGEMVRYNTMPRNAVSLELERQGKSEELRVLYVAMTRAREKLYMISSHKDCEKYVATQGARVTVNDSISPYIVRKAECMSNWITLCALTHPSGQQLRNMAGIDIIPACDNEALWDIQVFDSNRNTDEKLVDEQAEAILPATVDIEQLKQRFNAVYPYEDIVNLPTKVSVSQVAHDSAEDNLTAMAHPSFLLNEDLSPAQKGTAIHAFMQYADYRQAFKSPQAEVERLRSCGYISNAESQVIDIEKIHCCLNSSIMKRYLSSAKTFREYQFTVKVDCDIIEDSLWNSQEKIIMQGAVDCAFVEDDQLVIVDYKTDKVDDMNILASRYKKQLNLYKIAMEQSTGMAVKQCVIYSFAMNDIIEV